MVLFLVVRVDTRERTATSCVPTSFQPPTMELEYQCMLLNARARVCVCVCVWCSYAAACLTPCFFRFPSSLCLTASCRRITTNNHITTTQRRYCCPKNLTTHSPYILDVEPGDLFLGKFNLTEDGTMFEVLSQNTATGENTTLRCPRQGKMFNWADVTLEVYGISGCDNMAQGAMEFRDVQLWDEKMVAMEPKWLLTSRKPCGGSIEILKETMETKEARETKKGGGASQRTVQGTTITTFTVTHSNVVQTGAAAAAAVDDDDDAAAAAAASASSDDAPGGGGAPTATAVPTAAASLRAIPTTMRAVVGTKGYKGKISDVVSFVSGHPVPSIGDGQILIHVNASSVNPVDWKIVEEPFMGFRLPHVLGFDCSGTVAAVGAGVSRLKVGDEVWADLGKTWPSKGGQLGAYAEYALADESQVGLKPTSLSFSAAASLPLVSLTDLQAYRKMLGAASLVSFTNKTVVVTSGSGGTGVVAVQLAKKAYGAKMVITACGPSTQAFCKSLGADVVVDYTAGKAALWDAVAAAGGSDMVFDNYGAAGTADLAMPTLKVNGVFLFLPGKGGAVSTHPKKGVHQINFGLADATHYADLDALKGFADKGQLSAHVSQTFPLEKVAEAFEASIAGGAVGKIGVSI